MIEEINDASSTLSKTGKADDPVSLPPRSSTNCKYLTLGSDTAHPSRPSFEQPSFTIAADRSRCRCPSTEGARSAEDGPELWLFEWSKW